jgi:hypothetical protein
LFREIVKSGAGEDGLSTTAPEDEPNGEPMICTCDKEHAGRPPDRRGCGAFWNLTV